MDDLCNRNLLSTLLLALSNAPRKAIAISPPPYAPPAVPAIGTKNAPASAAAHRTLCVLPTPGGPHNKIPLNVVRFIYFFVKISSQFELLTKSKGQSRRKRGEYACLYDGTFSYLGMRWRTLSDRESTCNSSKSWSLYTSIGVSTQPPKSLTMQCYFLSQSQKKITIPHQILPIESPVLMLTKKSAHRAV